MTLLIILTAMPTNSQLVPTKQVNIKAVGYLNFSHLAAFFVSPKQQTSFILGTIKMMLYCSSYLVFRPVAIFNLATSNQSNQVLIVSVKL